MKRIISALCLMMLLFVSATALAGDYSIDFFRQAPDRWKITPNESEDVVFVDCTPQRTIEQLSFTHRYEHPTKYSFVYTDLLTVDYSTSKAYPVLRTWVEYCGTERCDFDTVTITLCGRDYTFTDVSDPDWVEEIEDGGGYAETLLIIYGKNNLDFAMAVLGAVNACSSEQDFCEKTFPMTLSGRRTLEVELSGYAVLDMAHMLGGFFRTADLAMLEKVSDPTPVTVTDAR